MATLKSTEYPRSHNTIAVGASSSGNMISWLAHRRDVAVLMVALTLLIPGVAVADTHYVSKTGSNTPPYTSWETATDSISLAVNASDNWDTIRVSIGTFYEHSVWLKTGTTLVGAGIDSTILVSTEPGAFVTPLLVMGDSSQVEGFYLLGNGVDRAVLFTDGNAGKARKNRIRGFNNGITASLISFKDAGARVEAEENTIELCEFPVEMSDGFCAIRNNRVFPPYSSPAIHCLSAAPTIEGNIIGGVPPSLTRTERARFYGPNEELVIHQSITLEFCPDFIVRNNLIWGGSTGIFLNNENQPSPSLPWGTVENNVCFDVRGAGVRAARNNVVVRNNIVANSGRVTPPVSATLDSVLFEYNLLWDYDIAPDWDTNLASDNVFADPMFVDTVGFKLQLYSPAIDAGDPSLLDLDGSRSDIGAYGGPLGQSYTYADFPPKVPAGFAGVRGDTVVELAWNANTETDLSRYEIYRDTIAVVGTAPELLLGAVAAPDTIFLDTTIISNRNYFYRLLAADGQNNVSTLSGELYFASTGVDDGRHYAKPIAFTLHPNYPNPFNSGTRVRFAINGAKGGAAWVDLRVYDILGRQIRTLKSGITETGEHTLVWDGRDEKGRAVSSGVYVILLQSEEVRLIQKALLLR